MNEKQQYRIPNMSRELFASDMAYDTIWSHRRKKAQRRTFFTHQKQSALAESYQCLSLMRYTSYRVERVAMFMVMCKIP